MLVVNPTPFSLPLNSANTPTESVETQNRLAERIPESVETNGSSKNQGADNARGQSSDSQGNNTDKTATDQQSKAAQGEDFQAKQQRQQEIQDQGIIRNLAAIDRRVKAHEQAHSSVGGVYAGSASFTYQTGPNGVRYAVGGEVPIDTSAVPGNPQATLRKAQQVARAALAPADPSSTDRRVAASSQALATRARFEIARLAAEKAQLGQGDTSAKINGKAIDDSETLKSDTSFTGGKLRAALASDATDQVGGQVSASA